MTGDTGEASAQALVARYLRLCEQRAVDDADSLLAPRAVLEFPGPRHYSSVRQLAADAAGRYTTIAKSVRSWRCARLDDGADLVVCSGELSGTDLSGKAFGGIRFIDVFEVAHGRIRSQRVFNDLAEAGVVPTTGPPVPRGTRDRADSPEDR